MFLYVFLLGAQAAASACCRCAEGLGFEVSYCETAYVDLQETPTEVLRNNHAMLYHARVRMKF